MFPPYLPKVTEEVLLKDFEWRYKDERLWECFGQVERGALGASKGKVKLASSKRI